ncbi:DUF975 family protein [Romboutsia sp. 13368]|uniref:DUF975 family protein n=1 Tax=Romboutsia sp. 13368 TaxID=2708053 RepID=UPI0025E2CAD7|nr:DUF975 family protein [Romboutsia sp. 13368]
MILRKELKQNAKKQLQNHWGLSIGAIIVCMLISLIPELLVYIDPESAAIAILITIISLVIAGPIAIGQCKFFINLSNRENPKISDLWFGFRNILRALGVTLLVGIAVFIGAIFLIIPGIIVSFMYSQVYYIMAEHPEMSVIECLKESSRIMKGHKMELFILELSFIGWIILTVITFGIAGLYVLPYYSATLSNYYLTIKD